MTHSCAVVECTNNSKRNWQKKYYTLPSERDKRGRVLQERIKRRRAWIEALHRSDLTDSKIKNMRICSDHFVSGKPAELGDIGNPDYVPHVNMGYRTTKGSPRVALRRYTRVKERELRLRKLEGIRRKVLQNSEDQIITTQAEFIVTPTLEDEHVIADEARSSISIQTSIDNRKMQEYEQLTKEVRYLNEQVYRCRIAINSLSITEDTFKDNDKKTKYYTGIPTYNGLIKILGLVENDITNVSCISKFQQFILTLMHLRLDLMFTDLAYRFNISIQSCSRIFYKCLSVLYKYLKSFIIWPDRDALIATMPDCFKKHFQNKVTVIIDCFEVKIQKSSNLYAQAATWSNYKNSNTIKMLIGICPQGSISFISKAYGGRNSDKMITEKCGILNNLLPGDLVLADRGFLIQDSVKMRLAEVKTPAFLNKRKQLDPIDLESTRHLANVRIHVERVIGAVRGKYRILHNLIPLTTIKKRNLDMNIPVIDEIVTVTCALTNLCPSVVS